MGVSREEQETLALFDPTINKWRVYSCYSPHITQWLKKYGEDKFEKEYEEGRESPVVIRGLLDEKQISFRKGNKKMELTEEQRKKRAEAIKVARQKKNNA